MKKAQKQTAQAEILVTLSLLSTQYIPRLFASGRQPLSLESFPFLVIKSP
jgi:hypothetical protein